MKSPDLTPIDVLDQNILNICTRINADTYELLVIVREFDERGKWRQRGRPRCLCAQKHRQPRGSVLPRAAQGHTGIGRKSRVVPKAIERAVRARDKQTCRFPGCRNKRFVDIHHIEHRADGGETATDTLMLLCSKHHTLVHEGGFRIDRDFQNNWTFFRPDGIAVPDCGYHARDMVDDDSGARYENPPRGGLLSAVEKLVNEPPPPVYLH